MPEGWRRAGSCSAHRRGGPVSQPGWFLLRAEERQQRKKEAGTPTVSSEEGEEGAEPATPLTKQRPQTTAPTPSAPGLLEPTPPGFQLQNTCWLDLGKEANLAPETSGHMGQLTQLSPHLLMWPELRFPPSRFSAGAEPDCRIPGGLSPQRITIIIAIIILMANNYGGLTRVTPC